MTLNDNITKISFIICKIKSDFSVDSENHNHSFEK